MPRYLYTVKSNVCECGERKGQHPYNAGHTLRPCVKENCDCQELRLAEHQIEADMIQEVAEKLNMKLDDMNYINKVKI